MNLLLRNLAEVEAVLRLSKMQRILSRPGRYVILTIVRIFNKMFSLELNVNAPVFFNESLCVILPASADIYLFGAKTHDSEIRLTKFLIDRLKGGSVFIDIGAHFGFYSRLASTLVGATGKVFSFEPSGKTFQTFKKNYTGHQNILGFNKAVSGKPGILTFYEYPTLQSEYNTSKPIENVTDSKPVVVQIAAVSIDSEMVPSLTATAIKNTYVKIDVEGAEYDVLLGMNTLIEQYAPTIVIEYFEKYPTSNYLDCVGFLLSKNYQPFIIDQNGQLQTTTLNPQKAELVNGESDNIAFCLAE
ncbi:MAG: hypothetical protein JWO06_2849 [Bacteroidota bacterium]|nr:hypothetical protein [Bacteroidota bacterium]